MNLKIMNEAFKRRYSDALTESVDESYKGQLKKALVMRSMNVVTNGGNIKDLEIALQGVIEEFFPDKSWWEVTDCNIFMELLGGANPREVCDMIVDQIKDDCCEDDESKSIKESIDDVKKVKQCIQSWVTGRYDGGGQNSAYFAKWLAESEAGLDWEKIAEVAYLMGYDVYKSSYGYFGDEDYLIVYPGHNPEIYASNLDDESREVWENEVENDLVKVESFNSKSTNYDRVALEEDSKDFPADFRYYVYKNNSDVVSDSFDTKEDAVNFAKENGYPIVKIHNYYIENDKHYPDGDPVVVWNKNKYIGEAVSNPERTISKVDKNLAKEVDKDLVRDLTLCIENDGEVYRRSITPVIKNLKRKRAKGQYDEKLAIQAFFHVVEGALRMPHFYRYYTYSIQTVSVPERYAVAKELLDGAMDEIEFEDMNENLSTAKLKGK